MHTVAIVGSHSDGPSYTPIGKVMVGQMAHLAHRGKKRKSVQMAVHARDRWREGPFAISEFAVASKKKKGASEVFPRVRAYMNKKNK